MASGRLLASVLFLAALAAVFCGFLKHTARLLSGVAEPAPGGVVGSAPAGLTAEANAGLHPRRGHETGPPNRLSNLAPMGLLLGCLALFSVWLPSPLIRVIRQAAHIIGGQL